MNRLPTLAEGPMRLLARLARDTGGNTLMIVAAALLPLLAMVGGGIDMGRGYVVQTRLQHACDAGVLAARKRLGTEVAVDDDVPDEVAAVGQRFFDVNFPEGDYGTEELDFAMVLESDYAITGEASIEVPTTLMTIFGYSELPVAVDCRAQITMSNTDIMMVLDTTGSMLETNPGDTMDRISALRSTVKSFYAQMEANRTAGTRIRYGFLPYSTNVNVGDLLEDDWLVDEWQYNFRKAATTGATYEEPQYESQYAYVSGTETTGATYFDSSCPPYGVNHNYAPETVDADGWTNGRVTLNGTYANCSQVDTGTQRITPVTFANYIYTYRYRQTGSITRQVGTWRYNTYDVDLSFLATSNSQGFPMGGIPGSPYNIDAWYRGCVEERDTYEINDYNNVNLERALDLDIDRVPDAGDPRTQWRPMLNELSFVREMRYNGSGAFTPGTVNSDDDFVNAQWSGFSACPSRARMLNEMSAADVASYVDNLQVRGSTYHDIGMIWGGRLLSPTGLFAAENADVSPGKPTSRHLIFLTDGETAPLDISYGTYGIEPIDRRRWSPTSSMTLAQTVENRFSFACQQVKNRNITVWVISFGTAPNPVMQNCAGANRYFVAADATELQDVFNNIANRMSELRMTD